MAVEVEWFGCATFRMKVDNLTIFLDAYIDRAPNAAGAGRSASDIDECNWIVIGHSHFDHLYGAEQIMANTSATLIGSYETIRVLSEAGVPESRMICVAGGETIQLSNAVSVSVYPSQHSCVWSHHQMSEPTEVCLGDLGVTWHEQQERMKALQTYLATGLDPSAIEHLFSTMPGHSPRGDGGALLFQFTTPDGTLLYQDTSGHWSGVLNNLSPDVAILAAAGRANIDGEPVQGSLIEFLLDEVKSLNPRRVMLCHHDDWLPGFSVPTDMAPIREAFAQSHVELVEADYLVSTRLL